ncbi:ATP phosphoribosyltransferase regulatory subunit [Sporanaerobium hydrogeniformans]|uniref:ATP phosphoribosyltransferase regulatory subunit n=1 Tax=Sporanaerobium hydrogeniformans TaxID=3072179 RepID=A0AC61DCH1_9FIRM|nr:ATP phosphoribosyltransferase regulatory subunit [Sporanaerobium hydrogeniformans]PHV71014.1 ATP phosphoribosyltransferase regulatory subunit [Sporanaerobium hydrogeniformans]
MKNYTLHIPEGVRDYIGEEASIKETLQNQIKKVFTGYSYNLIETPTFEYLDVFTLGENSFQKPQLYHLINRQGEVVALRSDMTRAIARVASTQNSQCPFPQRYAYMANSFRYPERYQGKLHEFTQGGIELIGINSIEADAEVIKVAIDALRAVGVEDFTIHIGSSQFLEYTLSDIGLSEKSKEAVYKAIDHKDAVSLRSILEAAHMDSETLEMLLELMQCAGKIELLRSVKERMSAPASKAALTYLEELYEVLEDYGASQYVLFDFSLLSYANYYTGVMFQIFTKGVGSAIVEGGRYDGLLQMFKENRPAVGFGVHIHLLLQKLLKEKVVPSMNKSRTLVFYKREARQMALKVIEGFRKDGLVVETSFFDTFEETLAYGKQMGMGGVLYFKEDDKVEIYNLEKDTMQETNVNAL